ncbi:uncharacterized protein LOC122655133 [Telopea speciosissima]|uniref:uncharacterized protein LOC122655133 n=1 Tax=Telopea speciosissima TaxID=54955 RepID=UPI001CC76A11|nr:uncharacterized protein LOC122655133 [Telopea speciosissima]
MAKLTKKGVKFEWNDACEKSFQELRNQLVTAPVLTIPDGSGGMVVYTNVSRTRLGGVLMQRGTISIASIPAYDLFDSGASNSFVSSSFAKRLGISPKGLAQGLAVSTPTGGVVGLDTIYEPCPIWICGHDMIAHLVELDMRDFDAILVIDWLAAYRANLAWAEQQIAFKPIDGEEFVFQGDRGKHSKKLVISSLQAKQLIDQGCECYLASVIDTEARVKPLGELKIVKDFPDVFPDDLIELPLDRETEFVIDLLPGAAPVSKAPYRMAPTELRELQEQLQDLLKKCFIHPSVSP